ncbi:ABC transporter ATP-binding protein [Nocardia stercoris]|uniref:ATP-binding cassette domain-containing protein n=1 Tax=Nocardia stercoris TaxID=2483361 RepID=A0A3M2L0Q5_9NOCA|nr:ATP-binding cassette domain-containing protein [Nocardia stercoris]RMI31309.1 ATP-binding cassette domain-containing protein [Nocardia stercoris]
MITVTDLTKRYRRLLAVDDVSFHCRPGTVTGFLGPNGAGKSSVLRTLTGLSRPDAGETRVGGMPFTELPHPARVAGVMLDAAALHPGWTGRDTLRIAATMIGVRPDRTDALLDETGLTAAADRRVGTYSLGMRQRLGLAQALVGDPSVLILDEPSNGLDPEGIAWTRTFLRDFARRGGTVLLSSHLLSEIQAVADHLVIIRSGQVVADGDTATLLGGGGLLVRATDQQALARLLARHGASATTDASGALRTGLDAAELAGLAAAGGVVITELRPAADLEDLFLALTTDRTA